jgi:hypothetical protein
MAEALKRQYGLLSLKVRLDTYGDREAPEVRLALETRIEGQFQTVRKWEFDVRQFGLPSKISGTRGQTIDYKLPTQLIDELKGLLHGQFGGKPLWLHLVRPYGYVGLIPWERMLVPVLNVPILRLPDFIVPPPRESPRSLDVLLCASAPRAKELFPAVGYLGTMARRIVDQVPRLVRLHCFTDGDLLNPLRAEFQRLNLLDRATLYDPHEAEGYRIPPPSSDIVDQPGRLRNPWLLWMRDALHGKSVDVVHILCHGYFSNDRGALAVSESPMTNADPRMSRFIGSTELSAFLTQVGAWASAFSSPSNNYSDLGSRALAEELGQTLPGAVLYHDAARDRKAEALGPAYRFLFSRAPEEPPASPDVFIYCQPHRVANEQADSLAQPTDDLSVLFEQDDNVPAWLAASQRYLEKCGVDVKRTARARNASPGVLDSEEQTLKRIQDVIARVARSRNSP